MLGLNRGYIMQLQFVGGRIATIRDFRYIPYIAQEANIQFESRDAGNDA